LKTSTLTLIIVFIVSFSIIAGTMVTKIVSTSASQAENLQNEKYELNQSIVPSSFESEQITDMTSQNAEYISNLSLRSAHLGYNNTINGTSK